MAIDKIWVLAESADGAPTPVTLELLTKARAVGSTVEAVAWGADVAALAGPLGEYGATTVYDVGDIGDALPGVPVAAAIAALIGGGQQARRHLLPRRATRAATSPGACRRSSTRRCSRT